MKRRFASFFALVLALLVSGLPAQSTVTLNRDDGAHAASGREWWHLTGHLKSADGHQFGYQLTFFRFDAAPTGGHRGAGSQSGWHANEFYPAVLAVTDDDARRFVSAEKLGRPVLGIAGASTQRLSVHVDDWRLEGEPTDGSGGSRISARALDSAAGIDLELDPAKQRIDNGDRAVFQKGDCSCSWRSTSYSRLATHGSLRFGDSTFRVTGVSRLDHEFGPPGLPRNTVGWSWFGFTFDDGREVMLYVLRHADGKMDDHSIGTIVNRDGSVIHLNSTDFSTEGWNSQLSTTWFSPHSSAVYPALWKISIPSQHLLFSASPLAQDQEVQPSAGGLPYWEGSVVLQDEFSGGARIGDGFVSLVGFVKPVSI